MEITSHNENFYRLKILSAKLEMVQELVESLSDEISITEAKVGKLTKTISSFDDATLGLLNGLTKGEE